MSKLATSSLFIPITFFPSTACSTSPACGKCGCGHTCRRTLRQSSLDLRGHARDMMSVTRTRSQPRSAGRAVAVRPPETLWLRPALPLTSMSFEVSAGPPGTRRLTNKLPRLSGLNAMPRPQSFWPASLILLSGESPSTPCEKVGSLSSMRLLQHANKFMPPAC